MLEVTINNFSISQSEENRFLNDGVPHLEKSGRPGYFARFDFSADGLAEKIERKVEHHGVTPVEAVLGALEEVFETVGRSSGAVRCARLGVARLPARELGGDQ